MENEWKKSFESFCTQVQCKFIIFFFFRVHFSSFVWVEIDWQWIVHSRGAQLWTKQMPTKIDDQNDKINAGK